MASATTSRASAWPLASRFREPLPQLGLFGVVGATHGLLAWLGFYLATGPFNLSPIWPAAGFALVAIFVFGYRVVPVLFVVDYVANVMGTTPPMAAVAQSLANVAGPALGAALIRRYVRVGSPLADSGDMVRFLTFLGFVVPAATAALGIGGIMAVGELLPAQAPKAFITWWVGDAVGHLIVFPFLITWLTPARRRQVLDHPWRGAGLLLLLAMTSGVAFWQGAFWGFTAIHAEYVILPVALWVTVTFGLFGAANANLIIAAAAISATLAGLGHYSGGQILDLVGLEGLLLLIPATTLMLGIVVTRKELALDEAREAARLKRSVRDLQNMIDQPYVGMLLVDRDGIIRFANSAAAALMSRNADDLPGSPLGVPLVTGQTTEIQVRRGTDEIGEAEISTNPIRWDDEVLFLVTLTDVTERNRAERAVRHQAYHDDLTGLPNRTYFEEQVRELIRNSRARGTGFAVLFLDLDRFKEINDTLGHAAGDELLRVIAQRLQAAVRREDLVARMSGDEFTILLHGIDDPDTAWSVAAKLRERTFAPLPLDGQSVTPTGTMGISLFPRDGEDVETLVMEADAAMYTAKEAGRDRIQLYTPEHSKNASRRFQTEQALRRAWTEEEFFLVYQPQVTAGDRRRIGMEALLRWEDPDRGVVSPGEFIPLLEETGMIKDVGEWAFQQAHTDIQQWRANGLVVPRVWINVAAQQLEGDDLVTRLDRLVQEQGLDPECFGLELTESGVAGNLRHSRAILTLLRKQGFALAMDDFGTGYSALSFLRELPFDTVKIDREFVQRISENPRDDELIRTIIAMAHGLGMDALAEGVETEAQAEQLRVEGCNELQGFLISRPVPADQVPQALEPLTDR